MTYTDIVANLWSAPLASGQRTAHRPVAARRSSPHIPHWAEQHAGKGTPTSGRHRCAQRRETTHRPVAVQRSSPHIPHRAEQHAGKGTPTSGRHRCAQRRETTHRPVAVQRSSPHIPHRAERRAGKGTPTSGRHRWPPASARRIAPWERRSSDRHSGPQGRGGTAPGAGETPTPLPARSVLLRTMAGEIPSYPDLRNAR